MSVEYATIREATSHELRMAYRWDDFTDQWDESTTVVMFIHGNSESGRAWDRWVGPFARHHKILRPDMRGFGQSDAMPETFEWTLDVIADDFIALADSLHISKFHLVGAKLGGMIALHLAARHPLRLHSLSVVGAPVSGMELTGGATPIDEIREHGVGNWAARTMAGRLGAGLPKSAYAWWTRYMNETPVSSQLGFLRALPDFDVREELPAITCPTLVMTANRQTAVGSEDSVTEWQRTIPRSQLRVIESDGYHFALVAADRLSLDVANFIDSIDAAQNRLDTPAP